MFTQWVRGSGPWLTLAEVTHWLCRQWVSSVTKLSLGATTNKWQNYRLFAVSCRSATVCWRCQHADTNFTVRARVLCTLWSAVFPPSGLLSFGQSSGCYLSISRWSLHFSQTGRGGANVRGSHVHRGSSSCWGRYSAWLRWCRIWGRALHRWMARPSLFWIAGGIIDRYVNVSSIAKRNHEVSNIGKMCELNTVLTTRRCLSLRWLKLNIDKYTISKVEVKFNQI